jgi:hypothetical protein
LEKIWKEFAVTELIHYIAIFQESPQISVETHICYRVVVRTSVLKINTSTFINLNLGPSDRGFNSTWRHEINSEICSVDQFKLGS